MIKVLRGLLVGLLVVSGFVINAQDKKDLTNQDIWYDVAGTFRMGYVSGVRSMNDGQHYTKLDYDRGGMSIGQYKYGSPDKVSVILNAIALPSYNDGKARVSIEDYQFSADESQILISTAVEKIYRHSSRAYYFIYDRNSKETKPLSNVSLGKQRLAQFSPDGKKVGFVRLNNLFVVDLQSGKETQITTDGEFNKIINGATDWVYEEEFGFDNGLYWSPNSSEIAYYKSDESNVEQYQMPMYDGLYPSQYIFKYPKAGEENSKVDIYIYNLKENKSVKCDAGKNPDQYIPRIKWMKNDNQLCIMRLNRHQNHLEFLKTKFDGTKDILSSEVFYTEKSDTYVEITDNLIFLDDQNNFIWTSEKDGYNHIYKFNLKGKEVTQITKGKWDVTEFKGVNNETNTVYYISAETSAMDRDVYKIGLDGSKKTKLSKKAGQNDAIFSKGYKYFINYHSDANTPYYITLHDGEGNQISVLEDNANLKSSLAQYNLVKQEFFTFKTSEGIELNGWMMKPPGFEEKKNYKEKYPVFMTVYNGPGINTVNNSWGSSNYLWYQLLAQKGYIVVSVDGRGTGYRGAEFKKCTYQQLGKLETKDQIEAAKYLGSLPYVDENRIGIQGWSYGGYMSSLCITLGAEYFKMAIAVAPVTNWRFYDTIYTERYMRTPQENADGYDNNSPISHVDKLEGKYLLVHGSADDNVHFQNTMEMVNALVKANKDFDMFAYPNKNHGIYGGTTRLHLFNKMTKFIEENL